MVVPRVMGERISVVTSAVESKCIDIYITDGKTRTRAIVPDLESMLPYYYI
jgi:predicted  nucleic acid-binding Zn ribbon protein